MFDDYPDTDSDVTSDTEDDPTVLSTMDTSTDPAGRMKMFRITRAVRFCHFGDFSTYVTWGRSCRKTVEYNNDIIRKAKSFKTDMIDRLTGPDSEEFRRRTNVDPDFLQRVTGFVVPRPDPYRHDNDENELPPRNGRPASPELAEEAAPVPFIHPDGTRPDEAEQEEQDQVVCVLHGVVLCQSRYMWPPDIEDVDRDFLLKLWKLQWRCIDTWTGRVEKYKGRMDRKPYWKFKHDALFHITEHRDIVMNLEAMMTECFTLPIRRLQCETCRVCLRKRPDVKQAACVLCERIVACADCLEKWMQRRARLSCLNCGLRWAYNSVIEVEKDHEGKYRVAK